MAQLRFIGRLLQSIPFFILVAGVAGFWFLSQLREPPETRKLDRKEPAVDTVSVSQGPAYLTLSAQGEVTPYRQVSLMAQVSGRIATKSESCRAGNFVKAGTLLVVIDPRDYTLNVKSTQQAIAQTDISIEENDVEQANERQLVELAEEDVGLQRREVERLMELNKERVASQSQLEAARRALLQSQNALQISKNRLRLLKTRRNGLLREKDRLVLDLERASLNLERTKIEAPIDGVIVEDLVEEGDFVQAGGVLVRVEDTSRVEVWFDLRLDQLRWIWASQKQQRSGKPTVQNDYQLPPLRVDILLKVDQATYVWQGELARYEGAGLNPATRTVPCVAVVDEPSDVKVVGTGGTMAQLSQPPSLLRGMFVTLTMQVPCGQPTLSVPVEAIRPGDRVWVYDRGRLEIRQVRTVQRAPDVALLLPEASDLTPGESVIVSPLAMALDGMAIRQSDAESYAEQTRSDWPARPVSHRDNDANAQEVSR